jgi:serine/threonine protein phosphatase PrpC
MDDFLSTRAKSLTHPGRKRPNNEDFVDYYEPVEPDDILSSGSLYIVADGVGGAAYGERASRYAVQKVLHDYYQPSQLPPAQRLEQAMLAANADIHGYSKSDEVSAQMATTIVAALVFHDQLIVANVGDSPAYLIRAGQIRQLSRDHSLVGERIRDGSMTEEEARTSRIKNQLTRSLGGEADVIVDVMQPVPIMPGDRIVLCTDGVTRYASRQQILQLAASGTPEEATNRLIDYANQQGGADNITALVVLIETREATDATIPIGVVHRPSVTSLADMDTYTPGASPRRHAKPLAMAAPAQRRRFLGGLPVQSWMLLVGLVVVTLAVVVTAFAVLLPGLSTPTPGIQVTILKNGTQVGSIPGEITAETPAPTSTVTSTLTRTVAPDATNIPYPAQPTKPASTVQPGLTTAATKTLIEICVYRVDSNPYPTNLVSTIAEIFGKNSTDIEKYYEECHTSADSQTEVVCSNPRTFNNAEEKSKNVQLYYWLVIPVDRNTCFTPIQPTPPTPLYKPGKIYISVQ